MDLDSVRIFSFLETHEQQLSGYGFTLTFHSL